MGRGDLTNPEWDRLQSFSLHGGARGGRWSDHRRVTNGVLYRVRTGVQWRDLPKWSRCSDRRVSVSSSTARRVHHHVDTLRRYSFQLPELPGDLCPLRDPGAVDET
ncbi:transposase [Streptomyces adustus]|uniref:transposase n=1 Tax=Streptomyces adustus TaxID=1609272 RepID=UPI0037136355